MSDPGTPTEWTVNSQPTQLLGSQLGADEQLIKWASDKRTGQVLYLHDPAVINGAVECTCACGVDLIPVLAGQPNRKNPVPHFRHAKGSHKRSCTLVSARLAVLSQYLDDGFIDLPKRRMSATAVGFSGAGYEGWVEAPAKRAYIIGAVLQDHATAVLRLKDGSELLVNLTGEMDSGRHGGGALITLAVDDPSIAGMSPEEIRSRLRLLAPSVCWYAHWNDVRLRDAALESAQAQATGALDEWSDEDDREFYQHLPNDFDQAALPSLRRETLLHREVKAILDSATAIAVPSLVVQLTRHKPEEFVGEWEDNTLVMEWVTPDISLDVASATLERNTGSVTPDVVVILKKPVPSLNYVLETWIDGKFDFSDDVHSFGVWPETLLIEVAVTHGIDDRKLQRIRKLNLPTLEIDIGSLGGKVTRQGLRELVLKSLVGKTWVHHPVFPHAKEALRRLVDEHPVTRNYTARLLELRRPIFLRYPPSGWAKRYLDMLIEYLDVNSAVERGRRQHTGEGPPPVFLGPESKPWKRLLIAADALEVHGYHGAKQNDLVGNAGVLSRMLSIKLNRGVGYNVNSDFQVVNAIMNSGPEYRKWHGLYVNAVHVYGLHTNFKTDQLKRYEEWRQAVLLGVENANPMYMRPTLYDPLLGLLFPEIAASLMPNTPGQ